MVKRSVNFLVSELRLNFFPSNDDYHSEIVNLERSIILVKLSI
jgi:hypothetical protein